MRNIVLSIVVILLIVSTLLCCKQKPITNKRDSISQQYFYSLTKGLENGNYCGNRNRVVLNRIKKTSPFNKSSKIKLVSFKLHSINPKSIDSTKFIESEVLESDIEDKFLDVLVNFKMQPPEEVVFCYSPRNAILFLDEKDKIIGSIFLCFECSTSFDRMPGTDFFLGTNCPEKWKLLKDIFIANGIIYGTIKTEPAHEDNLPDNPNLIYTVVDKSAEPFVGYEKYYEWINKHIRYPKSAKIKHKEGKVFIRLVVEKDGSVSNAEVIKGFDKDYDREALRVVMLSPKWKPGKVSGELVRQAITIPVKFKSQKQ